MKREAAITGKADRNRLFMATIDTIAGVLESNLDIDPATVTPEATFESLGIDSLDMVELICDLEEACEVDFGEPEGLVTVGAVLAAVQDVHQVGVAISVREKVVTQKIDLDERLPAPIRLGGLFVA